MSPQSSKVERTCQRCGKLFLVWPFKIREGKGLFCGTFCARKAQKKTPRQPGDPVVRFWKLVDTNGPIPVHVPHVGPCWAWKGTLNTATGYAQFGVGGRSHPKTIRASRFSWELHNGAIPDGLFVLHRCDNEGCVRPEHLFLGTQADNMADKVAKSRQDRGESHWKSTITEDAVREGKRLYRAGGLTMDQVAEKLGASCSVVRHFLAGESWTHVE